MCVFPHHTYASSKRAGFTSFIVFVCELIFLFFCTYLSHLVSYQFLPSLFISIYIYVHRERAISYCFPWLFTSVLYMNIKGLATLFDFSFFREDMID